MKTIYLVFLQQYNIKKLIACATNKREAIKLISTHAEGEVESEQKEELERLNKTVVGESEYTIDSATLDYFYDC